MITNRPKIICHMVTSIDGKVTGSFLNLKEAENGIDKYYDAHKHFGYSFACGRVTMEESFTHGYYPDLSKFKDAPDYEGDYYPCTEFHYVIAFDRYGKLGWKSNILHDSDPRYDGFHILEVVTKKAPKEYLAYLRSIELPYIICGEEDIDLELAMLKLYHCFHITGILLEGGSIINGEFHKLDLIDQLSIFTVPIVADNDSKSLFTNSMLKEYQILSSIKMEDVVDTQYYNNKHDVFNASIGPKDINECLLEIKKLKDDNIKQIKYDEDKLYQMALTIEEKLSFDEISCDCDEYGYIELHNDIIHPYMLKFIPKMTGAKERTVKNILSGHKVAIYNEENGNFSIVDYRDVVNFNEENYYILSNTEHIREIINSMSLEEFISDTDDIESKKIYQAFIDNELALDDIFTSKILITPYIKHHIDIKKKTNSVLYKAFIDILTKNKRYNDVITKNAPRIIRNFEAKRLQNYINNYYDLCLKLIKK